MDMKERSELRRASWKLLPLESNHVLVAASLMTKLR